MDRTPNIAALFNLAHWLIECDQPNVRGLLVFDKLEGCDGYTPSATELAAFAEAVRFVFTVLPEILRGAPSDAEVARRLGISRERVRQLRRLIDELDGYTPSATEAAAFAEAVRSEFAVLAPIAEAQAALLRAAE